LWGLPEKYFEEDVISNIILKWKRIWLL
jgi:hypothetical protein